MQKKTNGKSPLQKQLSQCITVFLLGTLLLSIVVAAWYVLHGSIIFHTDIARDFLLFEDIAEKRNLTLIGPRSGGIPGVFHGPLWLYVNVPAYFLSNGNPVGVGWFWVLLFLAALCGLYLVTKRVTDNNIALYTTALTALVIAPMTFSLYNPSGALFLFPLFFICAYYYLLKRTFLLACVSFFLLGCIIQFQMAFGVPIMFLFSILFLISIIKHRQLLHIFAVCFLVLLLSSFILFEVRHQFVQIKAVLAYTSSSTALVADNLLDFTVNRLKLTFFDGVSHVTHNNSILLVCLYGAFTLLVLSRKKLATTYKQLFALFLYFYLGFFGITFFFRGFIWEYYYLPFIPIIVFAAALSWYSTRQKLAAIFLALLLVCNVYYAAMSLQKQSTDLTNANGTWQYFYQTARMIYSDAGKEFGYFVYTADQYGYSDKYAMHYAQKQFPNKTAYPYVKKPETYLLISPDRSNRFIHEDSWKKFDINIDRKPDKVIRVNNKKYIEKYNLTPAEATVSANPNLIDDLIFR